MRPDSGALLEPCARPLWPRVLPAVQQHKLAGRGGAVLVEKRLDRLHRVRRQAAAA